MKTGFYAGSFDPFTFGHLKIVIKASKIFDKVIIGIGINPNKKRRYGLDLMVSGINKVLKNYNLTNCEVVTYTNLTCDYAKLLGANYLIRGLRNSVDYDYEENLASINEEISQLDTIYFRAGNLGIVSSSMAYELFINHKDVSKYIPKEILEIMLSVNKQET